MEAVTATPEVVEERPATPTVQAISIAIRLRPFIARAHVSPHQSPLLLAGLLPRCPRGIQSHAILLDT